MAILVIQEANFNNKTNKSTRIKTNNTDANIPI